MLINCPECGLEISDKARSCPRCGYSLEDQRQQEALIEAALRASKQQEAYDATFKPSSLYLSAPLPLKALCKAFSSRGRATRAEYWSYFALFVGLTILFAAAALHSGGEEGYKNPLFWIWFGIGFFALLNATERRLHDAGASDALTIVFLFALLVPVFGWTLLFLCGGLALFQPSVAGSNQHGPHPDTFYSDSTIDPKVQVKKSKVKVPVKTNRQTQPAAIKQDGFLTFTCPNCGKPCEVPNTVADGQHILCPYCEQKFSCHLSH